MTLNKQLINLLGILLAVIVLVAGLALIAYPMFSQAQTLDSNTATVAQTNSVYQAQVDSLTAAEKESDQLDASLADLRLQIAAMPKLDDVYEIVDDAAKKSDVRVENITADEVAAFTARAEVDADGKPVEAAPAPAADTTTDATTDGSASTDAATDTTTTAPEASTDSPQQQVTFTVTIDMTLPYEVAGDADAEADASDDSEPDPADVRASATDAAEKAAAFVDALDVGPRLLAPVNVAYADGKLTLSTLAFIRTEDAQ